MTLPVCFHSVQFVDELEISLPNRVKIGGIGVGAFHCARPNVLEDGKLIAAGIGKGLAGAVGNLEASALRLPAACSQCLRRRLQISDLIDRHAARRRPVIGQQQQRAISQP